MDSCNGQYLLLKHMFKVKKYFALIIAKKICLPKSGQPCTSRCRNCLVPDCCSLRSFSTIDCCLWYGLQKLIYWHFVTELSYQVTCIFRKKFRPNCVFELQPSPSKQCMLTAKIKCHIHVEWKNCLGYMYICLSFKLCTVFDSSTTK